MNCKYCDRPLPGYAAQRNTYICRACSNRLPSARRFVEECDKFKKRINYAAILRERKRRANQ